MRIFLMAIMGLWAAAVATGCHDDWSGAGAPADGSVEATALLRAMSYPGTTVAVLAVEGGLSVASAARIVAYRDGADGRPRTKDDQRFGSVDALGAVSGVAGAELGRLADWALARGWDDGDVAWVGSFDGVGFSVFDAEVTLDLANRASVEVLDGVAGLRADAAASIVAARPLGSVGEIASLPRVGQANLAQLRGFAVAEAERAAILAP